jgi:hypothetical protein
MRGRVYRPCFALCAAICALSCGARRASSRATSKLERSPGLHLRNVTARRNDEAPRVDAC